MPNPKKSGIRPFMNSAKNASASYTDFYNGNKGGTRPDVSRTGSGTKPAISRSPREIPVPESKEENGRLTEKAKALQRRLASMRRLKNAGTKAGAALKKNRK